MEGAASESTGKCVGKGVARSCNGDDCGTQLGDEMEVEEGSVAHRSSREHADSDDEDDEANIGPSSRPPLHIHRVVINRTPYKTYRALLYYLAADDITFANSPTSPPPSPSPPLPRLHLGYGSTPRTIPLFPSRPSRSTPSRTNSRFSRSLEELSPTLRRSSR